MKVEKLDKIIETVQFKALYEELLVSIKNKVNPNNFKNEHNLRVILLEDQLEGKGYCWSDVKAAVAYVYKKSIMNVLRNRNIKWKLICE